MAKMNLRSSPAKDPKKESPPKSQGITKNPSLELCCFTDPEIDSLRHCLLEGTIFRPFDSSMKSDCVSDVWITFPASPFQIGFTYPFPFLTQSFFTLTVLCYIQAMTMVWRVLYTLENIIEQEEIDIGLSELSQFIQESLVTQERIVSFWRLDPATRTFQAKVKDCQEISSGPYTMSSNVTDIQEYISPRSLKKELAASQSLPERKGVSTKGKGTKRKKTTEPLEGLPLMEHQVQEYVSDKFVEVQILIDQDIAEAEQKCLDLQTIAVAKDKKISQLKNEQKALGKELLVAEMTTQRERIEVMEGAKHSAAVVMLKIKLQMAKEATDPAFDRSGWDVEAWKQRLVELRDEDEPKEVLALEGGGSEVKDPEDAATGGSGQGG
ncbi:hypothetical protein Hanom_Chr06g00513481 [Helianthus anomalus]